MVVDISKLTMPEWMALLRYRGKPPPGKEFDKVRMTQAEWDKLMGREEASSDAGAADAEAAPTAQ